MKKVFNAAVTNNDDHPRNHALLRHSDGWRFSPAYDVVPMPVVSLERRDLALIIRSMDESGASITLISQCARFGLTEAEARKEISHIASVVGKWRERFAASVCSTRDVEYIAPAMLPPSFLSETPPQPL